MVSAGKLDWNSKTPEENQTLFSARNSTPNAWANIPLYTQSPWWETQFQERVLSTARFCAEIYEAVILSVERVSVPGLTLWV